MSSAEETPTAVKKEPGKRGRKPRTPQDPNKKVRKWIYNPNWEEMPELKGWLTKSQQTQEDKAFCLACDKLIRPHLSDIRKHGLCSTHVENCHRQGIDIYEMRDAHLWKKTRDEEDAEDDLYTYEEPPVEVQLDSGSGVLKKQRVSYDDEDDEALVSPVKRRRKPKTYNDSIYDYGDLDDEDYGKPIMGRAKSRPNIILKIRVANTSDPDFIEIDLPRRKLKLHSLIVALCEELEVQTKMVEKVRKLPNTRMRRDIEVRRLQDYDELELVLFTRVKFQPNASITIENKSGAEVRIEEAEL